MILWPLFLVPPIICMALLCWRAVETPLKLAHERLDFA